MYNNIEALLHLDRRVVGVKLIYKKDLPLMNTIDFEHVKHKAYYCWLVRKASEGRAFKLTFDQFACETAGWVLGLAPEDHFGTPKANIDGWLQCGTFANEKVAKMIYEGIKPLQPAEGILIAPLHAFPDDIEPDVVMIIGNAYTLMRVVQSHSAHKGFVTQIKMSGMCGICFESTAHPLQTQNLSLSALCSGTRFYAKWGKDEMVASLPFSHLQTIVDGAHQTMNPCEPDDMKVTIQKRLRTPLSIHFNENYYVPTKETL